MSWVILSFDGMCLIDSICLLLPVRLVYIDHHDHHDRSPCLGLKADAHAHVILPTKLNPQRAHLLP